jgi:hypothetical protein
VQNPEQGAVAPVVALYLPAAQIVQSPSSSRKDANNAESLR